jgi:cell division protein FtsB
VLIILVVVLQYRLWIGQGSLAELHSLKQEIALQEAEVTRLLTRNQELQAEVVDLSEGEEAVEERARTELGMIKAGEIFIQVIEKPKPEGDTP